MRIIVGTCDPCIGFGPVVNSLLAIHLDSFEVRPKGVHFTVLSTQRPGAFGSILLAHPRLFPASLARHCPSREAPWTATPLPANFCPGRSCEPWRMMVVDTAAWVQTWVDKPRRRAAHPQVRTLIQSSRRASYQCAGLGGWDDPLRVSKAVVLSPLVFVFLLAYLTASVSTGYSHLLASKNKSQQD